VQSQRANNNQMRFTFLRSLFTQGLKNVYRWIRYREERKRIPREKEIKRQQDSLIKSFDSSTEKLIVFLVPGADRYTGNETISGGVISLVSLCEESAKLKSLHHGEVIMTVFPGEYLFMRHLNFENETTVYRFGQLKNHFPSLKEIIIHIPDLFVEWFKSRLTNADKNWLSRIKKVHLNVINANILLMPEPNVIRQLEEISDKITITAGHSKYCTSYFRNLFGYPLHKFSAWISPEQYEFVDFNKKENIIVVSPDSHPSKDIVLNTLRSLKEFQIIEIKGIPYKSYKQLIGKAKFSITFGEGLDGYILEPIFSGTIGFAAYNRDFFTEDFKNTNGIFDSYEEMEEKLPMLIKDLNEPDKYSIYLKDQYHRCAKHYSFAEYQQNIENFYSDKYTFN
jgi:hypothetical protein